MIMPNLSTLYHQLSIYVDTVKGAKEIGDMELAERAQALSEETLAQLWAARKEQEKQKPKGLYYIESEPTT